MTTQAATHHDPHPTTSGGEHEHVHPPSYYVKIWAVLTVLFCISVAGPMIGIKIVTLITAFGIAIAKAYLVAAHFMHLNIERRFVVYLELAVLGIMLLFYFGVAPDVMKHEGQNWENVATKEAIARGLAAASAGGTEHAEATHQAR